MALQPVVYNGQTYGYSDPATGSIYSDPSGTMMLSGGAGQAGVGAGGTPTPNGPTNTSSGSGGLNSSQQAALAMLSQTLGQGQLAETIREFDQKFGLTVGDTMGLYNGSPTAAQLNQTGFAYGPGGAMDPTLAALQQAAGMTGLVPTNAPGIDPSQYGKQTVGTQALTGYITNPDGTRSATTAEQQVQLQAQQNAMGAINNILQANNNPANAFTYLSKLQGINNLGPTASLLRGALTGATGQSVGQLQGQPTVTNSNLMANLMGQYLGTTGGAPNTAGTGVSSDPFSTILGLAQSQGQQGQPLKPGQVDTNSLLHMAMSHLANSVPATSVGDVNNNRFMPGSDGTPGQGILPYRTAGQWNGVNHVSTAAPSGIPTGWGTSGQALAKMAPSLAGAYTNMVQNAGGENPTDFLAGVKLGMPTMDKSVGGRLSNVGNF